MNFHKIAEDVKNLANRYKALYEVSEAFEKLGSFEQSEKELKAKADKAKADADKAEAEKEVQEKALETAKLAVSLEYRKLDEAKASAQSKFAQIISEAKAKGDEVIKQAEAKAQVFSDKVSSAKAELFVLSAEVEGKKEELESVKSELEKIKAKFASFMKG